MTGYQQNIETLTLTNKNFRQVLYTSQHTQLVIMSLKPQEDIGPEIHEVTDQFFRIEAGKAKITINNEEYNLQDGDVFIVPAGALHNVLNTSLTEDLKLYTLYSPPHHKDGVTHPTKNDALTDSSDHL